FPHCNFRDRISVSSDEIGVEPGHLAAICAALVSKGQAGFGPQCCHNELLATCAIDRLTELHILPGIDGSTVHGWELAEQLCSCAMGALLRPVLTFTVECTTGKP